MGQQGARAGGARARVQAGGQAASRQTRSTPPHSHTRSHTHAPLHSPVRHAALEQEELEVVGGVEDGLGVAGGLAQLAAH